MKTLILTEKPSVARDFANALGVQGKAEGFLENQDYVIAWAIGHLVELLEPQEYDAKWKKWELDTLPILPDSFRYKPIDKTKHQLSIIQKILKNKSFDRVVIATDAGREGEVIARTILLASKFNSPQILFRFWSSLALTPQVIAEGMKSPKPLTEYDRLWRAGQSRQIADWLVGMNFSRAATITLRDLFSVGRVQTAVLALLVDRRREREAFKPEPYWLLTVLFSNGKGHWLGTWFRGKQTRFDKKEDAERILAKVLKQNGVVLSVQKEKKRQPPPLLYSLTDLQQDANKRFGFTAQETLDAAQRLYEKHKCLSYPRTDAKVLGSKNADMVRNLVKHLARIDPPLFAGIDNRLIQASNKRVFNDDKLTDHHALIPLAPVPGSASEGDKRIHDLVMKRFAAAFYPDCEYEQTEIITGVCDETFRTRGKTILKPGWRAVYGVDSGEKKSNEDEPDQENLPPLQKDDPAHAGEALIKEKQTTPPPDYTEALLLKDMTNPAKFVAEDELKKIYRGDVGLGTQATRAQIIETLLKRSYIERKKKTLLATDKGCYLIDTLRRFTEIGKIASVEETARWEMRLDRIALGQEADNLFLQDIQKFVCEAVQEMKGVSAAAPAEVPNSSRCPQCGGEIIEGKRGFGCSNWKPENGGCKFVIWKTIEGKQLTAPIVHSLIAKKQIGPLSGFLSEDKQPNSAILRLVQEGGQWKVNVEMAKEVKSSSSDSSSLGKCPDCGGDVAEGKKGYGCQNWRDRDGGCKFVIWKSIAKKKISKKMASKLLQTGKTDVLQGFQSKEGNKFSARLKIIKSETGASKIIFDFPDET